MNHSAWLLYSMRFAVGVNCVLLILSACTPAMARDVVQLMSVSDRQANRTEHRLFLSDAQGESAAMNWPVDSFPRALSLVIPDSESTNSDFDRQQSAPLSMTGLQDDSLEGYFQLVGNDGLGDCCLPVCENPCPCVYGYVEALFLMRHPQFNNQPVVVDPNTNTTYLSTSNLNYNYNPGLRATFGTRICGNRALEFTYLGLFNGTASATAIKPDPAAFLTFPDNLVGNVFVDMERVQMNYSSWLNSFEANLPCCCGCCDAAGCGECGECGECGQSCGSGFGNCESLTWFGGFRYLNYGEQFNIASQRTVGGLPETGSYNVRTANHLYGMQVGARTRRTQGRFGYEAGGKAGLFGNDSQQTQSVTDFPNFPLRPTVSNSSAVAAFLGEANLTGLYRLNNVWNVRAGYNVIWIQGLALAPNQLNFNFASAQAGSQLNNSSGLLLHGFNVGLEARW